MPSPLPQQHDVMNRAGVSKNRWVLGATIFGMLILLLAFEATSEGFNRRGASPDLNQLALFWSQGDFAAPVICEVDGVAKRGLRSIKISPVAKRPPSSSNRITFLDLDLESPTHCFDFFGKAEANVIGSLVIRLPGRSRQDTAQHDFMAELKHQDGFEFSITEGSLRMGQPGTEVNALPVHDLRGGTAFLRRLPAGSDEALLMAEFISARKFELILRTNKGFDQKFLLVQR